LTDEYPASQHRLRRSTCPWQFLVFVFAHDGMLRIHRRWFRLSRDQFDALHYAGMSVFKIGIILFNLVPFVALSILR